MTLAKWARDLKLWNEAAERILSHPLPPERFLRKPGSPESTYVSNERTTVNAKHLAEYISTSGASEGNHMKDQQENDQPTEEPRKTPEIDLQPSWATVAGIIFRATSQGFEFHSEPAQGIQHNLFRMAAVADLVTEIEESVNRWHEHFGAASYSSTQATEAMCDIRKTLREAKKGSS